MEIKDRATIYPIVIRSLLASALIAVTLGLPGCGKQLARIEQNQLQLQAMVESNCQQIAAVEASIQRNQGQLLTAIEGIQNGTSKLSNGIAAVADTQTRFQQVMQNNNHILAGKLEVMGKNQQNLQTKIQDVQSDTRKLADDAISLENEQVTLQEMVANNSLALVSKIDRLEQNQNNFQTGLDSVNNTTEKIESHAVALAEQQAKLQQLVDSSANSLFAKVSNIEGKQDEWQVQVDSIRQNIQAVTASLDALEQNLTKFHQVVQNDMQNLVSAINADGQQQRQYREKTRQDIQALFDSIKTIKQTQSILHKQIEDVHSSTRMVQDSIISALEQLQVELSQTYQNRPTKIEEKAEVEPPVEKTEEQSE